MSKSDLDSALQRWQERGLISAELAESLRSEHAGSLRSGRPRFLQYAVAGTAGILLVIAAATFFAWSWPDLGPGVRTCVIAGAGIATVLLGMRLEAAGRFVPVTYALQTSGLILLLAGLHVLCGGLGQHHAGRHRGRPARPGHSGRDHSGLRAPQPGHARGGLRLSGTPSWRRFCSGPSIWTPTSSSGSSTVHWLRRWRCWACCCTPVGRSPSRAERSTPSRSVSMRAMRWPA